ncbi:hypothetical protein COX11_02775, partial [Candidatus Berkelbacteria bacterium CG23_combo_of_CG06-09_8_20_14_all_41_73]
MTIYLGIIIVRIHQLIMQGGLARLPAGRQGWLKTKVICKCKHFINKIINYGRDYSNSAGSGKARSRT